MVSGVHRLLKRSGASEQGEDEVLLPRDIVINTAVSNVSSENLVAFFCTGVEQHPDPRAKTLKHKI